MTTYNETELKCLGMKNIEFFHNMPPRAKADLYRTMKLKSEPITLKTVLEFYRSIPADEYESDEVDQAYELPDAARFIAEEMGLTLVELLRYAREAEPTE